MNIKETAAAIHANAKAKGFWDNERNFGELLMLIVSELGEALEAHRKNQFASMDTFEKYMKNSTEEENIRFIASFEQTIKDSVEDEISDSVIRLFDLAEGLGINLEKHIELKMRYNTTRDRLHGKAY